MEYEEYSPIFISLRYNYFMLPPKYSAVLLIGLVLCGCLPRYIPPEVEPPATYIWAKDREVRKPVELPRRATKSEKAKARIKEAEAIRIARKAFAQEGWPIAKDEVPDARYIREPAYEKTPAHFKWLVYFVPKKHIGMGLPGVAIDDQTGKVQYQAAM